MTIPQTGRWYLIKINVPRPSGTTHIHQRYDTRRGASCIERVAQSELPLRLGCLEFAMPTEATLRCGQFRDGLEELLNLAQGRLFVGLN